MAMETAIQEGALQRYRPYPAYKDSGVEWLGEIPEHWEVKRLRSTVTSSQNGVWGDEPDGLHDIACVRVADFNRVSFRVDIEDPTFRSVELRVASARGLKEGNLLLEKSGGGENQPVGAVVLFDHAMPAVCSNFVARVVLAGGFDPKFMTYLHAALYSLRINTRHIKQSTGIQNLDSASYLDEAVGLPCETEQCAIVSFLDRETARIDALVAKKQRLIELLQEKRTALITRAVTKGLDPTFPMKDSGVEWLGEIPEHWEVMPLSRRIVRITYGFTNPMPVAVTGPYMLTALDIGDGEILYDHARCTSESAFETLLTDKSRPKAGDLLITKDGTLGRVAVADNTRMCINQSIALLRFHPSIDIRFMQYLLRAVPYQERMAFEAGGTAIKHIYITRLARMSIAFPGRKEQCCIAVYLDKKIEKTDALISKVRTAIDRLQELRTALISAAVTGKIDVREEVV